MKWPNANAETLAKFRALQERLAARVSLKDALPPWRDLSTVAGADVSMARGSKYAFAAVVILDAHTLDAVEIVRSEGELAFPYIPGYLSFRELPMLLNCFERLRAKPDVVICDGQGLAHPRRFGIACHLGVELDLVTIGCGKSLLIGDCIEPGHKRGSKRQLLHNGEKIGEILRTRDGVSPLYISPGHKISFARASQVILTLCQGVRQPEPIRVAHRTVNEMRRASARR